MKCQGFSHHATSSYRAWALGQMVWWGDQAQLQAVTPETCICTTANGLGQMVWWGVQAQVQAVAPRDLEACTGTMEALLPVIWGWKVGITTKLKPILNYQHFFKLLKPCQSWLTCRKILMVTTDGLGWVKTVEWEIYNRPLKLEARIQQSLSAVLLHLQYLLSKESLHSRRVGWW